MSTITKDPLLDPDRYPPGTTAEALRRLHDAMDALPFEVLRPIRRLANRLGI